MNPSIELEVRFDMSSGKIRVLVFAGFLMLLLIFAVAYQPTNAASWPTNQNNAINVAGQ